MRKSAMITECWTPRANHNFSLYMFFFLQCNNHVYGGNLKQSLCS